MYSLTMKALALSLLLPGEVFAAVRKFHWNLTYEPIPGTAKETILINGKWPPESIEVDQHDRIVLTVVNDQFKGVAEGVTVHAHGFFQQDANIQDGPVGVTQCDIKQGSQQVYTWDVTQVGTFWVHSHHSGQYPYGLRSPLIVRSADEPAYYGYDAQSDYVMDITDNWHRSMADVEADFKTGRCCFDYKEYNLCGMEIPPDNALVHDDLSTTHTYKAKKSNNMRVRIINMSASSSFYVFADNPDIEITVIEADGVPFKNTNDAQAKSLQIHPGQRYSVVIKSDKSFNIYSVLDPDQYSGNSCQQMNPFPSGVDNKVGAGFRSGRPGTGDGHGKRRFGFSAGQWKRSWGGLGQGQRGEQSHAFGKGFGNGNSNKHDLRDGAGKDKKQSEKGNKDKDNDKDNKDGKTDKGKDDAKNNTEASGWNYALMGTARFDLGDGKVPTPYFRPTPFCKDTSKPCYVRYTDDKRQSLLNLPAHAAIEAQQMDETWATSGRLQPKDAQPRIVFDENSIFIDVRLTARPGALRFANMNDKDWEVPEVPLLLRQTQSRENCPNQNLASGTELDAAYGTNNTWYAKRGTNVFFIVGSETGPHPFLFVGKENPALAPVDRFKSTDVGLPTAEDLRSGKIPMPDYPLRRDTIFINSKTYSIIAITANNPGAWFLHCHNDFHSITGMAGTLIVDSPDDGKWNNHKVGQAVWDQCGFKMPNGGGFDDWKQTCCSDPNNCQPGTLPLTSW
ncbi:multicopper oxidase [Apiospora kogelbergensis]|uniref:multicopper oxidase n=1 Tax=Apiospora kogelbergensis TaxID=1337665 RepID=UPI003131D0C6